VAGLSLDYAFLNPSGFYFYSIYNFQGIVNPKIGGTGNIETNDLVFGVHAFMLASITFS